MRSAPTQLPVVSAEQMQAIDVRLIRDFSIPSLLLMENAGRNVAEGIKKFLSGLKITPDSAVLFFCGGGRNGADGFVAARHLLKYQISPHILLAKSPNTEEAKTNLEILKRLKVPIDTFGPQEKARSDDLCRRAAILVDALVGTGGSGSLREPFASMVNIMNDSGKPIVAVDIPSGLDPNTGVAHFPTVKAALTITMGLAKKGLLAEKAMPYVGQIMVADLGIPIPFNP